MIRWWRDLSVSKKLYAVVGLMAVLIASELLTLLFAMNTLSSVRAFVMGEGLWTKSQKDAIHSLYQYALSGEEVHYLDFKGHLKIPDGDHKARMELLQPKVDESIVLDGFLQGGNHPNDIPGMIKLLRRFHQISYIGDAISAWGRADELLAEIRGIADEMHEIIRTKGKNSRELRKFLVRIAEINLQLTREETTFSESLGAGSRWLESLLMTVLALTVLTIEGTGLFLTYRFSRTLTRSLQEMRDAAVGVGKGNLGHLVPIHSRDELGQLGEALNHMVKDLRTGVEEKQRADEVLRRSEERFRMLIEAVEGYAIFILDPEGRVTTWNSGAEKLNGYPSTEIIGQHFSLFFTPEDRAAGIPEKELKIARATGRYDGDAIRIRKDGSQFWANIVIMPLHDPSGSLTGFAKIIRDITDRKKTELRLKRINDELEKRVLDRTLELQEREAQLRLITDALPTPLAELDRTEKFVFVNDAFCTWVGLEREAIMQRSLKDVIGDEQRSEIEPFLKEVWKGHSSTFERRRNGEDANAYSITLVPERRDEGLIVGFIFVANDVTMYKTIEAELVRARDAADVANETKSAFLANMSHEIRTPLGAVLGFSELLVADELSPSERVNSVEVIKRNGALLSNIISDILDLSKVEAGKLEIEKSVVSLEEVVREIDSLLNLQATEKGIKLIVRSEGAIPNLIKTDPMRLRQIILNIVGNAIKFTERGEVDVLVRLLPDQSGRVKLGFIVTDTGKGINPEQAEKLFTPFTQADPSTTRKFGGTGLGLVLSRKLAQILGGDVVLRASAPNKGSTFIITIDPGNPEKVLLENFGPRKLSRSSEPDKTMLQNLKVLLVDDSLDNQIIVSHFLRGTGAQVDTASNGQEGVEKALSGDYGVVLMDLQMPVMDGHEAIRELRRQGYGKPVIALTAHAMKEERKRCLESGFDEHVSKPINRDNLIEVISTLSFTS